MAQCRVGRRPLRALPLPQLLLAEARLVGTIEQLHAEVAYLRLRCEEEGVVVRPAECWLGVPGPGAAHQVLGPIGAEGDGHVG